MPRGATHLFFRCLAPLAFEPDDRLEAQSMVLAEHPEMAVATSFEVQKTDAGRVSRAMALRGTNTLVALVHD